MNQMFWLLGRAAPPRLRRSGLVVVASAGIALVVASCSSSSTSTGSTGSSRSTATGGTQSSAAADPLGPAKVATGAPIKVGFVTDGKTAAADLSSTAPAAQAAASYINGHLGGIHGHPIQVIVCDDQQTSAGATNCGNQMVQDNVVAVMQASSLYDNLVYPPVAAAQIPYVEDGSSTAPILAGKRSYIITNGLVYALAGPAKLGALDGVKVAGGFFLAVPSAEGIVTLTPQIYRRAGIDLKFVQIPPGTADPTPQVQSVLRSNPQQVALIMDPADCVSTLKAIKSLGYSKPIYIIQQCIGGPKFTANLPGGYAGMKLTTNSDLDPKNPQTKLFNATMAAYQPNVVINGDTYGGWRPMIAFGEAMTGLQGTATKDSVAQAFATMSPQPYPLGNGLTFQCDRKAVPSAPAICSAGALATTVDKDGNPVGKYTVVTAANLLG